MSLTAYLRFIAIVGIVSAAFGTVCGLYRLPWQDFASGMLVIYVGIVVAVKVYERRMNSRQPKTPR